MSEHIEYHVAQAGNGEHRKAVVIELTRSAGPGDVTGSRILAEAYDETDAKRIAACLGACQGVTADALAQPSLAQAYAHVAHQRDVLTVAAQKLEARGWFMRTGSDTQGANADMAEMRDALAMLREVQV